MAEISLRAYLAEVDELVEANQFDEAIAHCRHILNAYPKHLDTYRSLGKALLEKSQHGDAADIFQRVLSAVPDDFVAHVGMAIVREDESNLDAAIFHMQRAFEVNPANPAIQEELKRLFGRRDGLEPPRVRLSRGALARMYARGHHFEQAIGELRAALAEDADRPDLQVILAEAYWHAELRADAAETCAAILQKLPYCRRANEILAEIWSATGRAQEAQVYRERLKALDPYEAFADRADGLPPDQVPAGQVLIEKLDWSALEAAPAMGAQPSWVSSLGVKLDQPAEAEDIPDWLRDVPGARGAEAPQPAAGFPAPDWMTPAPAAADVEPAAGLPGLPAPEPAAAEKEPAPDLFGEVPDWLRDTLAAAPPAIPADAAVAATPAPPEAPEWVRGPEPQPPVPAPAAEPSAEVPDWLRSLGITPQEPAEAESAVPDWMRPAAPSPAPAPPPVTGPIAGPPAVFPSEAAPEPAPELPDWLRGMVDEAAPPPAEPIVGAPVPPIPAADLGEARPETTIPEWLAEAGWQLSTPEAVKQSEAEAHLEWQEPEAPEAMPLAGAEIPDWLRAMAPPEIQAAEAASPQPTPPPAPAEPPSDMPYWLSQIIEPTAPILDQPAMEGDMAKTPAWLREPLEEPEAPAAPPAEGLPAWLRQPLEEVPPSPEPEPAPPTPGQEEGLPDWLRSVVSEGPGADLSMDLGDTSPFRQTGPLGPLPIITPALSEKPLDEPEVWVSPEPPPAAPPPPPIEAKLAPPPEPPAPTPPAAVETPLPAEVPSTDEALAWLESLAARQGADSAELITRPEDRPSEAPSWIEELTAGGAAAVPAEPAPAAPSEPEPEAVAPAAEPAAELPEWLRTTLEPEDISAGAPAEPEAAAPALPEWVRIPEPFEAAAPPPPAVEPVEEVAAPPEAEAPEVAAVEEVAAPSEPEAVQPEPAPAWEVEADIAAFEAKLPAWEAPAEEPVEPAAIEEAPVAWVPTPPPPVIPEPEPIAEAVPAEPTPPEPAAPPARRPARVRPPRGKAAPPPDPEVLLDRARSSRAAGDMAAALDAYSQVIHSGERLPEVIADLEGEAARQRDDPAVLNLLGDAYMRDNQLQRALDTYRLALERV